MEISSAGYFIWWLYAREEQHVDEERAQATHARPCCPQVETPSHGGFTWWPHLVDLLGAPHGGLMLTWLPAERDKHKVDE